MVIHPAKSLCCATMASYSGRTGGGGSFSRSVWSNPAASSGASSEKRCHCPPSLQLLSDFLLTSSNTHSPDCRGDSCNLTRNTSQNIEMRPSHTPHRESFCCGPAPPAGVPPPPVVPVPVPALYFCRGFCHGICNIKKKFLADFAAELDLPCSDQPIEA